MWHNFLCFCEVYDCEFSKLLLTRECFQVYTTAGCELARVSVVGSDLKTAYEALVKPENHIIDYNTRYEKRRPC